MYNIYGMKILIDLEREREIEIEKVGKVLMGKK